MKQKSFLATLLILICSLALVPTACSPGPADTTPAIAPPVVAFSSVEDGIMVGDSTTLFWIVTGTDSVQIDPDIGGGLPAVGTVLVSPASDTTYTLTASNSVGSAMQSVTITVISPKPLMLSSLDRITLKPSDDIDDSMLDELKARLEQTFGCPVESEVYYYDFEAAQASQQKQYLAEKLIYQLRNAGYTNGEKVLGVVDVDFYSPGSYFILGKAELGGEVGVISVVRLRQRYYRLLSEEETILHRATKEALHELGHTLGLEHCPDTTCVMYYSLSVSDTDRKLPAFCDICRLKVEN